MGGTQPPPGAGDSVTGQVFVSNSNQNFDRSVVVSTLTSSAPLFASSNAGSFLSLVPYGLTIGVTITRAAPGTTAGDLNFSLETVAAVPEPEVGLLMAVGLAGLLATAQKRRSSGSA